MTDVPDPQPPAPEASVDALVEIVMAGLQSGYHAGGHHPNCATREDEGCDCYARGSACPQPNIWLGTSIESWRFNYRANHLRRAPAQVRFISAEPLLDTLYPRGYAHRWLDLTGIHWLIVGGESGNSFRSMNPAWVRELRREAQSFGASFFFKQWGGRTPKSGGRLLDGRTWDEMPEPPSTAGNASSDDPPQAQLTLEDA